LPSHKSCAKRMLTSQKERLRNRGIRSQMRNAIKELQEINAKEDALKKYPEVVSILDRAASYGVIHKKNAARRKSRLALQINKIS